MTVPNEKLRFRVRYIIYYPLTITLLLKCLISSIHTMEPTFIAVSTQIVKNVNISNTRTKRRFMYIDSGVKDKFRSESRAYVWSTTAKL